MIAGVERHCGRCTRPLCPQRGRRPAGHVRHYAGGLCETCYQVTHRKLARGRWTHCRKVRDTDDVAVDQLIAGTFTGVPTTGELRAAALYLTGHGYSANQIALRLGCSPRTVTRYRSARKAA